MWQAAVAVNDMCVLKGQTGTAFGLGESILFLFFFSAFLLFGGGNENLLMRWGFLGSSMSLTLSLSP